MKKNFSIIDGVVFSFNGENVDFRNRCQLSKVEFIPGNFSQLIMMWSLDKSNEKIILSFKSVNDFKVSGRDIDYPLDSGQSLAIAGFCDGISCGKQDEFYVEPSDQANFMSFLMDDMSAFLIRADAVIMSRV